VGARFRFVPGAGKFAGNRRNSTLGLPEHARDLWSAVDANLHANVDAKLQIAGLNLGRIS